MISYRDLALGVRSLDLPPGKPLLVHVSLGSFNDTLRGGPDALLGALVDQAGGVMSPTFTYKTMLVPESGPAGNGMTYGTGGDSNRLAEFFSPEMPVDPSLGVFAEAVRRRPDARRSTHPILSFAGIGVDDLLATQTLAGPLAPIGELARRGGSVVLIGVDHTANTAIHYAEALAGRKQFVRWALTPLGVRECPGFPGCSDGFRKAGPYLDPWTRRAQVGESIWRAIPAARLVEVIAALVVDQRLALLCDRPNCERCGAVRAAPTG